jgi:hypothetical protein
MKKLIISVFTIAALTLIGCKDKFDELSLNPNAPEQVPAGLVFNKISVDLYNNNPNNNGGNDQRPWSDASKYAQFWCLNYNYYGNQDYGWTTTNLDFGTLF